MTKHAEIAARLAAAIAQPRMLVDHATVPTELLADALAEITRLEAELGIAVDVAKRTAAALEKTCEREEAQRKIIDEEQEESAMWADKSNVMEAQLGEALAEVATLREALERITNVPGNRGDYAIEIARSSLATPTATAREES